MKSLLKINIIILLIIFGQVVYAQDEEPCKLILQNGLYKTFQIVKTENFQKDLKTYFSSEQFKKDFRDNKWGGTLSVVVDAIPIEIGANSSDLQINEFQSKVKESKSLTISKSFYDYAYTNIPDVELARAYTDCINDSRKFGFKVKTSISNKDVLFIISYYKEFDKDPMPIVKRFEIRNATGISKSFEIGDFINNQTSVSCNRDVDKDLIFVLETDRGIATFKVPAEPSGFNKDLPVGTIIPSYLTWTEFQNATKNNSQNPNGNIWSAKHSKWAPADGREIYGSVFYSLTNKSNIPDLRGMFLRGLNQFDKEYSTIKIEDRKDSDERDRGDFQSDAIKSHNHDIQQQNFGGTITTPVAVSQNTSGADGDLDGSSKVTGYDKHTVPLVITPNKDGSKETRPKNISIYYYIRIN